jgi:hypothetical protein
MQEEKKYWFLKISRTLWIPISWEGWATTLVLVCALFFIYKVNGVSREVAFEFARHWPMLLEFGITIIAVYWVTNGHVKKWR